jgi:hypothetical protein
VCKNPQENPWKYLRNFLKHKNPQETILNCKIRRKNLKNTCGLFSAGNSAANKQNFSSEEWADEFDNLGDQSGPIAMRRTKRAAVKPKWTNDFYMQHMG